MNAQYINSEWGFVMNFQWFEEKIQDPDVDEKDRRRLKELRDFWRRPYIYQKIPGRNGSGG